MLATFYTSQCNSGQSCTGIKNHLTSIEHPDYLRRVHPLKEV